MSWSEALGKCLVPQEGIGGFQSDMECDVYIYKYACVKLPSGTNMNMLREVLERTSAPSALDGEIIAVGGKTLSHSSGACEYVGDPVAAVVPD